jgi:hypothetical protein
LKDAKIGSVWIRSNKTLLFLREADRNFYYFDAYNDCIPGMRSVTLFKEDFNRNFYMTEVDPVIWYLAVMKDYWNYA